MCIITIRGNVISIPDTDRSVGKTISDSPEKVHPATSDSEPWMYTIPKILSDKPASWKPYIDKNDHCGILRMEMDEVLNDHAKGNMKSFKENLMHLASAAIYTYLNS